jgi:hypothetical protein
MYRLSNTVRSTHNQDGAIVLDIRHGQMFNVNFVGSRILELLKTGSTESEIVDQVSNEFSVSRDLAQNDVREFLHSMKQSHLVEEHEPGVAVWAGTSEPAAADGMNEVCTMSFLVLRAYLKLIYFDLFLARGNFAALYDKVRNYPVEKTTPPPDAGKRICSAVDMACIWYWKEALCLQRSAATSCLLKSHGISAQMVIGAQQLPFKAHAWVEVDGRVVNDKAYVPEMYAVLDRF